MAVVYTALQPALSRHDSIKVLPPYFADDEDFLSRFEQEAQMVARLSHPNILPIHDYGREGDIPYIVMPFVSGGTLRDWLARTPSPERAIPVCDRLLSALAYANAQHVVHRDVKHANVLMGDDDWPMLNVVGVDT